MDFSIETTSSGGSDLRWLASSHGTDTAQPGTLDLDLVYAAPNVYGIIPSGIAVGKVTATGRYGLFDEAATDGREVLAGFVLADVNTFTSLKQTFPSKKAAFALLQHGLINTARLPFVAHRTIDSDTVTTGSFVFEK